MNWQSIIRGLMASGLTQKEIGDAISLSQPAVSDICRGATKDVAWAVGEKLLELHSERAISVRRDSVSAETTGVA